MARLKTNSEMLKLIMSGEDLRAYGKKVEDDLWSVQQGTIGDYILILVLL